MKPENVHALPAWHWLVLNEKKNMNLIINYRLSEVAAHWRHGFAKKKKRWLWFLSICLLSGKTAGCFHCYASYLKTKIKASCLGRKNYCNRKMKHVGSWFLQTKVQEQLCFNVTKLHWETRQDGRAIATRPSISRGRAATASSRKRLLTEWDVFLRRTPWHTNVSMPQ